MAMSPPVPEAAPAEPAPVPRDEQAADDALETVQAGEFEGGAARPDRNSRRRNRRERQRAQRLLEGGAPGAEAGVSQPSSPEQVSEIFAQVLAGDFDADAAAEAAPAAEAPPAPVAAEESAAAHRRILAPDADAPKLQKVLGQAGVGSRRDIEAWLTDGRISVNGEVAHIGQRISFGDRIEVNGRPIKFRIAPPRPRVLAYHKPVGEVVTRDDPQQRPTVFRNLPALQHGKWQSVGRLDINT